MKISFMAFLAIGGFEDKSLIGYAVRREFNFGYIGAEQLKARLRIWAHAERKNAQKAMGVPVYLYLNDTFATDVDTGEIVVKLC